MKLNGNYCLMGLLILVLLYCCLGTNLLKENYDNKKPVGKNTPYRDFSHVAEDVAREGQQHAEQEYKDYQNLVAGEDLPPWSHDTSQTASPGSHLLGRDCASKGMKTCGSTGPNVCYPHNQPCPSSRTNNKKSLDTCDVHQKSGTGSTSSKCPSVTPGNYSSRDSCDTGYVWNSASNKCVKQTRSTSSTQHATGTYSSSDLVPRSQIPTGQEDQYILKSKIVPPVCPACPPVLACPSKGKCPPCPPPEPVQPCPPCARCPRNPFTCKKVPDYTAPNVDGILPRPMLNDFSQF